MVSVGIVYFSGSGYTHRLATEVLKGADSAGVSALLRPVEGRDIQEGRYGKQPLLDELGGCTAVIFGSPTYMGSVSAHFKAFMDATSPLWERQAWADKLAAGFTVGGAFNGDQGATLQTLATFAAQHGMLWVALDRPASTQLNRLGTQMGATARIEHNLLDPVDTATARYLGYRVATLALRWAEP